MGSKGTNTYTTNTQGPQWLQNAYQGVVGQAATAAAQPFQPYTGELVAGVNPEELGGIGQINNYATAAQPWLNQAAGYATNAAAPITASQIANYANPFTATVGGATLAELENLNAQQNQNVVGNAISSSAWGGDRASIAQAELAGQQARNEAPTLANIQSQGYTTGLQTALTEQQQEAQAAYSLGNIGSAMQTLGLTGAGAMIQGGQLQQGTQQQLDQARMQQWYTQQGYPFQVASWLAGIESGVGGVAGGTSQTTAPAPNPLSSILGLGLAGAGAASGLGWKPFGSARGGGIHIPSRYDGGGTIPYEGGINFIPSIPPGRGGAGPPKPPLDPSFMLMYGNRGQTGAPSIESGLGGLKSLYRNPGGISTDTLGSGAPLEGSADAGSLDMVVPMSEMGFGIGGVATGGGVMPEHAGLGFAGYADGGGPDDVMHGDPSWNQPPFMDESGRRSDIGPPPSIDATDLKVPVGGPGSSGVGQPIAYSNPALDADRRASAARSSVPTPSPFAPTGINPSGGVGSSALPADYADLARRPEDTRSWGEKLSLPLMQAGFAMMASRSPFLGEAIGAGGLSGIGAYVAQEKEKRAAEEKQEDIGLRAKQLSSLAEEARNRLALENKKEAFTENQPVAVPMGGTLVKRGTGEVIARNQAQMDPTQKEIGARRIIGGDLTPLKTAGYGPQGSMARQEYNQEVSTILTQEYHLTPQQAAETLSRKMQLFNAEGIGMNAQERALSNQEAKMGTAGFEALGAINLARDIVTKVPRTSFLPLNKLIQGFQTQTLNQDQAELYTRIQGVRNTYAAVMARGASVTTDSARARADELLNTAGDSATLNRVMDTMTSEIDMALKSPQQMREFYAKRYGQGSLESLNTAVQPGAAPGAAPASRPAAEPIVIQKGYRFQKQPDGSMKNLGPVSTAAPAMAS